MKYHTLCLYGLCLDCVCLDAMVQCFRVPVVKQGLILSMVSSRLLTSMISCFNTLISSVQSSCSWPMPILIQTLQNKGLFLKRVVCPNKIIMTILHRVVLNNCSKVITIRKFGNKARSKAHISNTDRSYFSSWLVCLSNSKVKGQFDH